MSKIKNGKIEIGGVEITVKHVLQWMKETNHYVTSVEMRDHFGWPMRQTCRTLMRVLDEEGKIIIVPNPKRKNSWIYGLPKMPVPNETYVPYKPPKTDQELGIGKFANNSATKPKQKKSEKKSEEKVKKPKTQKTKNKTEKLPSTPPQIEEEIEHPTISRAEMKKRNGKSKPLTKGEKVPNPWEKVEGNIEEVKKTKKIDLEKQY